MHGHQRLGILYFFLCALLSAGCIPVQVASTIPRDFTTTDLLVVEKPFYQLTCTLSINQQKLVRAISALQGA